MSPQARKRMDAAREMLKEIWLAPVFNHDHEAEVLTMMDLILRADVEKKTIDEISLN
jgi:hypothetical protein